MRQQGDAADRLVAALRDVINEAVEQAVASALADRVPKGQAPIDDRLLVTPTEAGRLLSLDGRTIRRLIEAGEIEARGHGRGRRITVASLREFAARQE